MAPLPSSDADSPLLDQRLRTRLLALAAESIRAGLRGERLPPPRIGDDETILGATAASFVTLKRGSALRGCIGTLEAHRALAVDVAENAFAAAFRDPRFPPLTDREWPGLDLSVSVLGAPRPLHCDSQDDLLRQVRPGIDGLILEDGEHRGTFLPAVWEQLPEPREFIAQLKRKAGLPAAHWSDRLRWSRYTSQSFSAPVAALSDR